MENEQVISVVVPVYNAQQNLRRCVGSILAQSYRNLEVILVDDGSTDKSGDLCDSYAKQDARVKVLHKENGGVSQARNAGIKASGGKYLQFVDSDDTLDSEFCRIMVDSLEQSGADLAVCGYRAIHTALGYSDECRSKTGPVRLAEGPSPAEAFLQLDRDKVLSMPWNKLFIREKVKKGFRKDIALGEDKIFVMDYLEANPCYTVIADMLYDYYVDNENTLSRKYSPDRIRYVKAVTEQTFMFCDKMFGDNYDKTYVYTDFMDSVNATVDLCLRNTGIPFGERYRQIKTLIGDPQVKKAAANSSCAGLHAKAMAFAAATGSALLVLPIAQVKVLARKALSLKNRLSGK